MKIFNTFSNNSYKGNAMIVFGLFFALFLFPKYGFTDETTQMNDNSQELELQNEIREEEDQGLQRDQEPFEYSFPEFEATIHSKIGGGRWVMLQPGKKEESQMKMILWKLTEMFLSMGEFQQETL